MRARRLRRRGRRWRRRRRPDRGRSGRLQPIHQYHLDGDYQDDYGGPALTPAGGTFTAGGYQFGPNQGLSVSGAMPDRVYTVDLVFAFDTLSGWHKILDFKDLVTDEGYYTYGDLAQFVVVAGSSFADGPPGLIAGTTYQMTLSRDAAATVTAYVDGAQVFQFVDAAEVATLVAPGGPAHFFIDDNATGQGEAAAGTVRRIRIFDVAATPSDLPP
ncbi:MAG: hypothetical protein IPL61_14010 [Myxococcales bacterium]|nr:hypothetical protein [Myxococcales bacterium]